jgi:hypothetical protein
MGRLIDYVGQIYMVIEPDAYIATDGNIAASDNDSGVPIEGMEGVSFIALAGDIPAGGSVALAVQYASNGNASDAVSSNAGMTCSDALLTLDTDSPNEVQVLYLDIEAKGLSDNAGKLYVAATLTGNCDFAVMAIPEPANVTLPASQENTIVVADDTE